MFDFSEAWTTVQQMVDNFVALLPKLGLGLIVIVLFYFVSSLVASLVAKLVQRSSLSDQAATALGRLARWLTVLVGILVGLVIAFPTFEVGQLVQVLGIGSVAIGFAFRDILQNFLAGILLLLSEPFQIGDQIIKGDFEGTVKEINTRATTIRTYDGRRVVIPNSELFTDSVTVNTALDKRRSQYDVGIGYGDDIAEARKLIVQAMEGIEGILSDPAPEALVVALADFSVVIRARWWTQPTRGEVLDTQDKVLEAIKNKLVEHGFDLPFPTQQILFHDQTEETDGDRTRQREGWPAAKDDNPKPKTIASVLANQLKVSTGENGTAQQRS